MTTAPINTVIFAVLLIALILAALAWLIVQRKRSQRLKRRFGPEYDLTVSEFRSQSRAEAELIARENRVARLKIVPLAPADKRPKRKLGALAGQGVWKLTMDQIETYQAECARASAAARG